MTFEEYKLGGKVKHRLLFSHCWNATAGQFTQPRTNAHWQRNTNQKKTRRWQTGRILLTNSPWHFIHITNFGISMKCSINVDVTCSNAIHYANLYFFPTEFLFFDINQSNRIKIFKFTLFRNDVDYSFS